MACGCLPLLLQGAVLASSWPAFNRTLLHPTPQVVCLFRGRLKNSLLVPVLVVSFVLADSFTSRKTPANSFTGHLPDLNSGSSSVWMRLTPALLQVASE
jgi:hypothetical protein